jgi:hypothetical protein
MANLTGQEFNYDSFQSLYDANPTIQNIVANFDENGLSLNVKNQEKQPVPEPTAAGQSIDKTAKAAAQKTLDRP